MLSEQWEYATDDYPALGGYFSFKNVQYDAWGDSSWGETMLDLDLFTAEPWIDQEAHDMLMKWNETSEDEYICCWEDTAGGIGLNSYFKGLFRAVVWSVNNDYEVLNAE